MCGHIAASLVRMRQLVLQGVMPHLRFVQSSWKGAYNLAEIESSIYGTIGGDGS